MPTKDGFDPAHPLPRFLADQAGQDIGNAVDEAASTSRLFKASVLIAAAAATGIAALAAGDPVALLGWGPASLVGNSSQSAPAIQSAADAPAPIPSIADAHLLPPAARNAPARDELAASEPAAEDRTENRDRTESRELPSETLMQFKAWAAEREAKARGEPVPPVQDTPAQVAQDAPAQDAAKNVRVPDRLVQKPRQDRSIRNARAEMRTQRLRKQVRRAERARAERPPVQDARAQDTSVQNAPPLPYYFGLGNFQN